MTALDKDSVKVGIVGLGYIGLRLAIELGKKYTTVGFDTNKLRVNALNKGQDSSKEVSLKELKSSPNLVISSDIEAIRHCSIYIVAVPTPIYTNKQPDLTPLTNASKMIGPLLSKDNIVIYESTVYPGVTEDVCIPLLASTSGLTFNKDFFAGYSPERINPGDKLRQLINIKKVTSGSTPKTAEIVDQLYASIILAGTHKAPSIKVAEASKVIENVQRDVNIALMNELHQVFVNLGINTKDVIDAAATKWNFMQVMPGMVGGHCISIDPYYLLHKSENAGYIPDLMRTAREINDGMPKYFADDFLRQLVVRRINPINCKILILGFTFKENCADTRNTKVYDLHQILTCMGLNVTIYDPWIVPEELKRHYDVPVMTHINSSDSFDVGFLAVAHSAIIDDLKNHKITFTSNFIYDFNNLL